jgi:hypothetical protein
MSIPTVITVTTIPPTVAPTGTPGKGSKKTGGIPAAAAWVVIVCVLYLLGVALGVAGGGAASNKPAAPPAAALAPTELVAETDVAITVTPTEPSFELGSVSEY